MKSIKCVHLILFMMLLLSLTVSISEARGGRRGGGSFGGIFGGWRKYKKPTSNTNSRRTVNGSPMHTTLTKSMSSSSSSSSSGSSLKTATQTKTHASYPKQQIPASGMNSGSSGSGAGASSAARPGMHVPPGATYYASSAAIPPGAIYYAQPPSYSSSSGTGNFLLGMMTGHMLHRTLFSHYPQYMTHVYQQAPLQNRTSGGQVIIINNNNDTSNANDGVPAIPDPNAFFDRGTSEQPQQLGLPQSTSATAANPGVPSGIICIPIMLNETDSDDPRQTKVVEKTICYPAPPPPAPSHYDCVPTFTTQTDPNDPTKTIQVEQQNCGAFGQTTTPMLPVAGDIEERTTTDSSANESTKLLMATGSPTPHSTSEEE